MEQLEGRFYACMQGLGQTDANWNRAVLGYYAPYFSQCKRVLDVGCGQGQFVELLRASGVDALGLDNDARMVEVCREKGLPAVKADLFDYLPLHSGEFDGLFSSNVVEHLALPDVLRFLHVASTALCPGGIVLIAAPNPESLVVHLYEFWRDATHVRLYNRALLEFLLSWAGFAAIQSGENPRTVWVPPPELGAMAQHLAELPLAVQSDTEGSWVRSSVFSPDVGAKARAPWQRWLLSLRRGLARFLAQKVLFEELHVIEESFAALEARCEKDEATIRSYAALLQSVGRAVQLQSAPFVVAREIFAWGVKPGSGTAEPR